METVIPSTFTNVAAKQEVLRAYIRELDSNGMLDADSPPPLMRGLLPPGPSLSVTPASLPPPLMHETSPKEMYHPAFENEKFSPSVKSGRPMPQPTRQYLPYQPPPSSDQQQRLSPQSMVL